MKKLDLYIKNCKKLIDMPYNELNLNNYKKKVCNLLKIKELQFINTSNKSPIKLMSGQDKNAGIIFNGIGKKNKRNIYLIGKGILFDSGGYNLKNKMDTMKCDMAGMAIAMAVSSYLDKDNVIAYCPVATNFIHNNGIIPSDIINIGKKKVEILNTDAEGRLILAEAISNLKVSKNDIVITIATLTGACAIAIGEKATAIMSVNDNLANGYYKASLKTKELSWILPMWEYIDKELNKKLIPNILKHKCGTINAGLFLKQFVKYENNFLHLDIAYSAYDENKRKATGEPIKTLVEFIKSIT